MRLRAGLTAPAAVVPALVAPPPPRPRRPTLPVVIAEVLLGCVHSARGGGGGSQQPSPAPAPVRRWAGARRPPVAQDRVLGKIPPPSRHSPPWQQPAATGPKGDGPARAPAQGSSLEFFSFALMKETGRGGKVSSSALRSLQGASSCRKDTNSMSPRVLLHPGTYGTFVLRTLSRACNRSPPLARRMKITRSLGSQMIDFHQTPTKTEIGMNGVLTFH